MVTWKIDEKKTCATSDIYDWVSNVCEQLAKDIDIPCGDKVLTCSGGPYRGADVGVYYYEDKNEMATDWYSYIRIAHDRFHPAYNYAKGLLIEACITEKYLRENESDKWKEKFRDWKQGMYKLAVQDQKDFLDK